MKLESISGRLRLRWTLNGQSYILRLRMADTPDNRIFGQIKLNQIQYDILMNQFDTSLVKYKSQPIVNQPIVLTVCELWERYCETRRNEVAERTYKDKWLAILTRLKEFKTDIISIKDVENFKQYLGLFNQPRQVKAKLVSLSACFDWAIARDLAKINPVKPILQSIKLEPKNKRKPFSKDEVKAICEYFKKNEIRYFYYVQFLFATGVRIAEAIGLTWDKVNFTNNQIEISASITKGQRKSTKTGKDRIIPINSGINRILRNQHVRYDTGLVFRSAEGLPIREDSFRERYWTPCLLALDIPYRPPYTTRHTMISHSLAAGLDPFKLAKITGHSAKVLFEDYADVIDQITLPEIF